MGGAVSTLFDVATSPFADFGKAAGSILGKLTPDVPGQPAAATTTKKKKKAKVEEEEEVGVDDRFRRRAVRKQRQSLLSTNTATATNGSGKTLLGE